MARKNSQKLYQKSYQKERYESNKEYRMKKSDEFRARRREWFDEIVAKLSCEVCGFNHPGALDFHHIDPATKDRAVSRMIYDKCSKEKVLEEIKKCKVLCSNCHRILHYEERMRDKNI